MYTAEKHPEVTVVEVHGDVECGACTTERLCGWLHNLVDQGERWLVVDLQNADSVHERALAELLAVLGRLRLREGNMVLVGQPGEILKAMRAMGFHELTLVLDDLDTAIQQAAREANISD